MSSPQVDRISIDPETIGHVLKDSRLRVPLHQRSYAWKDEHVLDLYQDLTKAIRDGDSEYFLGSIILVKSPEGHLEVNDGQQRLATSVILLAAIRNYFYRTGDQKTSGIIESEFLFSVNRKTHETLPRLQLNVEDNDYFVRRVLHLPDSVERKAAITSKESHKKIDAAAKLAAKHVKEIVAPFREQDKTGHLHDWVEYFERSARIIKVTVSDASTAYVIFETMNDRGLQLSAADLLKNHLYGLAEDRLQEAVERWQSMAGALATLPDQDETTVTYIRHMWISLHGPTRTRQLYEKIKEEVKNKQGAIDLATELSTNAPRYAALLTPSHEVWNPYDPTVRKHVDTLGTLGMKQVRPLLRSALERFPKSEIPKLLKACVCWSVRCLIAGIPSGTLEGYYGRNAFDIREKKIATVKELTKKMLEVIPDDVQFEAAVSTVRVSQAFLARYYLRALQRVVDGEKEPQYVPNDGGEVTLEHIMPQIPGPEWKTVKPEDHGTFVNRLGNLVLLQATPNSDLGNIGYLTKKKNLQASAFSLSREAGSYTKWSPDQIAERQKRLAELAVKTWPLKHG